jgi:Fe(3+) dicitrate transport protein
MRSSIIIAFLYCSQLFAQHTVRFFTNQKKDTAFYVVNASEKNQVQHKFNENNNAVVPLIANEMNLIQYFQNTELIQAFYCNGNTDTTIAIDAIRNQVLNEVVIDGENEFSKSKLNNIENTYIYAGKKTEVVDVAKANMNKATNNPRQIFSKVSGINIFENDGSGLSTNIGSRGLNPNRSSNFNFKQNYYDISADALGYPESYYTPVADMIDRVEIIRGAASLQFGTQFGGLVNFKLKESLTEKSFGLNARMDVGSFGFLNYTLQASTNKKKWSTYVIGQYKNGGGFRPNTDFGSRLVYGNLVFKPNDKWVIKPELTYFNYLAQQPGGLTDKQFNSDPTISTRKRNWFKVSWLLPSVTIHFKPNNFNQLSLIGSALIASRDALGILSYINRADPGLNRDLLSDQYRNSLFELRYLKKYYLFKEHLSAFLIGARYYNGQTIRSQGLADSTAKPSFDFLNNETPSLSSYKFPNQNLAFFTENIFRFNSKWTVTPGLRWEYINTKSDGYYVIDEKDGAGNSLYYEKKSERNTNTRQFVIAGIGSSYTLASNSELYCNFSQNYRSINFNDIRVINPNFRVDPKLKDETGYTIDAGLRGKVKAILNYDISIFNIKYNNRIGNVLLADSNTFNLYRYRTNISSSLNQGIDVFGELNITRLISSTQKKWYLATYINTTYIKAYYDDPKSKAYYKKKVEYAPTWNIKSGIDFRVKGLRCNVSYLNVSQQFSESTNATISDNAISGTIPKYNVLDLSLTYTWKFLEFSGSINNLWNRKYFTRRAEGYPGPGIIPADPRTFYVALAYRFEK